MSGVALLDKAGWAPLGAGEEDTHPMLVAVVGLVMLVLVPLVWGVVRRTTGLPAFGSPTLEQVEDPSYRPGVADDRPGSSQVARRRDGARRVPKSRQPSAPSHTRNALEGLR